MEEQAELEIEITDEGVVYIEYLTAGYAELDDAIKRFHVVITFDSEEGYKNLLQGYKEYLWQQDTVEVIHSKIDFLEYLYKNQSELADKGIATSYRVIKAASKILGISETELYKHNVERF